MSTEAFTYLIVGGFIVVLVFAVWFLQDGEE